MTRPTEVADGAWLKLRPCHGGHLLQHLGTGESKVLQRPCRLVTQEACGVVVYRSSTEDEPELDWACDLLSGKALMEASKTAVAEAPLEKMIRDIEAGKNVWRSTALEESYQVTVVSFRPDGHDDKLFLEAFRSGVARGGFFVTWGLGRLIHYIKGSCHDGRWVTKAVPGFRAFFSRMLYSENHLRPSRRSVSSSARHGCWHMSLDDLAEYDPDWSLSTEGLVLLCLHFATSGKVGTNDAEGIADRAIAFVSCFVDTFLDHDMTALEITDGQDEVKGTIVCEAGFAARAEANARRPGWASLLRFRRSLPDLLLECVRIKRRPSQHPASKVDAVILLLHNIVDFVGSTVEEKHHSGADVFKASGADHLMMPELYRTGSARPRRVSHTFKLAVSREVLGQPSLRNAQQLLAARKIFIFGSRRKAAAVKAKKKGKGLTPSSGRSFCQANMLRYMKTAERQLGAIKHGYLGCDGTRVSTKDMEFYVFEALGSRACWLVPKVPRDTDYPLPRRR